MTSLRVTDLQGNEARIAIFVIVDVAGSVVVDDAASAVVLAVLIANEELGGGQRSQTRQSNEFRQAELNLIVADDEIGDRYRCCWRSSSACRRRMHRCRRRQ